MSAVRNVLQFGNIFLISSNSVTVLTP